MNEKLEVVYKFVNYGEVLEPEKDTIALDVGMKTVPGVIDHHHPEAEPECTASLVVKYPHFVLDHLNPNTGERGEPESRVLRIITHRLPDFDSLCSIFLTLNLLEKGRVDSSMEKMAGYTRMVDSASLPETINLSSTPYSILRALFSGRGMDEEKINRERTAEGQKFMRFLHAKSEEGYEILENRRLFSGIDRYERAMRKAEDDYFNYLLDLDRSRRVSLFLPDMRGKGKMEVDGLIVRNPRSFLLKDWARRDKTNSRLGRGFSFLMTNFGNRRYILGVDPEKGVNLKGLGDMLNHREKEVREKTGKPFAFKWYDGNCPFFNFRIIDSPQDATLLSHEEIVETVLEFGKGQPIQFPA